VNNGTASMATDTRITLYNGSAITNGGSFDLADNAIIEDSGTGTNQVTNTGTLTKLTGSTNPAYISPPFTNSGSVKVGAGNLALYGTSPTPSTGSFEAGGGAVLTLAGAHTLGGTPQVKGAGTVQIAGSVDGTYTLDATAGTLELAGTLSGPGNRSFTGNVVWSSGYIAGGTTTIASGATLTVTNSFCFCHSLDGATLVNNGTASMATDTRITLYNGSAITNGGSFYLADNAIIEDSGTGTNQVTNTGTLTKLTGSTNPAYISPPFTNSGSVKVKKGVLGVSDYHQSSSATLVAEIRGRAAGTKYGQLQIGGTAYLDGILRIETTSFAPVSNDTFDIVSYSSRSGSFGSVQGASISGGLVYRAHYRQSGIRLVVEPPAAPPSRAITLSKTVNLKLSKPAGCNQNFGPSCTTSSTVTVTAPAYGGTPNASVFIALCNRQVLVEPNVDGTGGDGDPLGACDFGNYYGATLDGAGNLPGSFVLQLPSTNLLTGIDGAPSPNPDGVCPPTPAQTAAGWTCGVVVAEYDPADPAATPRAIGFLDVFLRSPAPTLTCGGGACANPTPAGTAVTATGVQFPCKVVSADNPGTSTYDGRCTTRWGAAGDLTITLQAPGGGALTPIPPTTVVSSKNGNYTITFTMPAPPSGPGTYTVSAQAAACSAPCLSSGFRSLETPINL
jgi:hypothetical protein